MSLSGIDYSTWEKQACLEVHLWYSAMVDTRDVAGGVISRDDPRHWTLNVTPLAIR